MHLHAESSCYHGCVFPQWGSAVKHQLLDSRVVILNILLFQSRLLAYVRHFPSTNRSQILVPTRAPDIPQEDL